MLYTLRTGHLQDAADLLPLLEQLGYPTTLDVFIKRLILFLQDSSFLLVAEQDSKIIGFVAVTLSAMLVRNGYKASIAGLVVDAHYRRQGIGQALMQAAEEFAAAKDCRVIELTSGLRRASEGTHIFYDHLGYHNSGRDAKLYLRKDLD